MGVMGESGVKGDQGVRGDAAPTAPTPACTCEGGMRMDGGRTTPLASGLAGPAGDDPGVPPTLTCACLLGGRAAACGCAGSRLMLSSLARRLEGWGWDGGSSLSDWDSSTSLSLSREEAEEEEEEEGGGGGGGWGGEEVGREEPKTTRWRRVAYCASDMVLEEEEEEEWEWEEGREGWGRWWEEGLKTDVGKEGWGWGGGWEGKEEVGGRECLGG